MLSSTFPGFYLSFGEKSVYQGLRHEGRGVYWEIPICASAFLGEEVVGIRRMRCSNSLCKKRVCDIWENRFGVIVIELKCPHCGEVVRVYWKPRLKGKYT